MIRPARAMALSAVLLAIGTVSALAQAPAPREIPKDFVLPGPAPTGAPVGPGPAPAAKAVPARPLAPSTGAAVPAQVFVLPGGGTTTRLGTGAAAHDWPCIQRKVERVDAGQVWQGPALETAGATPRTDAMRGLVEAVAQRRMPLPEAQAAAADFVAALPGDRRPAVATALFADLFQRLNTERTEVMRGIERYGAKQQGLAGRLRENNAGLSAIRASGDAAKAAEAQEALLWDTRIFEERRRSLTYVCEVPTLIEQRLFGLGRALAGAL